MPPKTTKNSSRKRFKEKTPGCQKFLLNWDDFKTPLQVSYNEETSSNTVCGGLVSLFLRLVIFAYTIQKFTLCFTRGQNTIIETANYTPFNSTHPKSYKLKDSDF